MRSASTSNTFNRNLFVNWCNAGKPGRLYIKQNLFLAIRFSLATFVSATLSHAHTQNDRSNRSVPSTFEQNCCSSIRSVSPVSDDTIVTADSTWNRIVFARVSVCECYTVMFKPLEKTKTTAKYWEMKMSKRSLWNVWESVNTHERETVRRWTWRHLIFRKAIRWRIVCWSREIALRLTFGEGNGEIKVGRKWIDFAREKESARSRSTLKLSACDNSMPAVDHW